MSRSLACELGPDGITVNMVAPGWMADEKSTRIGGSQKFANPFPCAATARRRDRNACVFFLSDLGAT